MMKTAMCHVRSGMRLTLLLFGLLLGATGCYEQNARVVVYPDGSGRIVVTRQFSPVAVRLIESQAAAAGGLAANVRIEDMFFSEKHLKADAKRLFGKGVRFVSAQRVAHSGGRGSVALYAFAKVDGLALQPAKLFQSSLQSMGGGGETDEDEMDAGAEEPNNEANEMNAAELGGDAGDDSDPRANLSGEAYRFAFQAGAQPKLTVRVPASLRPKSKNAGEESADEDPSMGMAMDMDEAIPEQARQQMMANGNPLQLSGNETGQEIMLKLCKGLRYSIDVEVRGVAATMTATNPDARQAGRCTLLRVDAEEILKKSGAKGIMALQQLMGGSLRSIIGKPGITTENKPEVTFTLKSAAPAVPVASPAPVVPATR